MIDFSRAFSSAWDRMAIILFRPFDLGKWFVIGFGAFLAGLLTGGNGANSSFRNFNNLNSKNGTGTHSSLSGPDNVLHELKNNVSHALSSWQTGLIISVILIVVVLVLVLALVFYWLGTRGQFIFLDNIVRNRAEVALPWQAYARQANSLFWFYLLIVLVSMVVFVPILVMAGFMGYPYFLREHWPEGGEWMPFAALGLVYLVLALLVNLLVFLFREMGVPLMFRHGWTARVAFMETMRLMGRYPGTFALFVLLRIAIAIAVWVLGVITCCCCVGILPYLGTVALLPALIFVRCFTLDCLAQMGPEYDVWTVDLPPGGPTSPSTFNLPPRLG